MSTPSAPPPPTPLQPPTAIPTPAPGGLTAIRSRVIRDIKARYHFRTDAANELWVWREGNWHLAPESWTADACANELGSWLMQGHLTPQFISSIHINLKTRQEKLEIKPPTGMINFLNGIWDAERPGELLEATPDRWPSPVQIPIQFDRRATCPAWDAFLAQILPADAIDFAWEIIGSCFVSDVFDQFVIWLAGEGGNGKGTFIKAIQNLLGDTNTISTSFKELINDKFTAARLYGKLLVFDPDSPLSKIKDADLIKKISAHDPVNAQKKYKEGFNFHPFCKIIVAANGRPNSADISKGFTDRPLIVPMEADLRSSAKRRRQGDILDELAEERAGALNRALIGLSTIIEKGRHTIPASIEEATLDYKTSANAMNDFAMECLALDPTGEIPEVMIRTAQGAWAQANKEQELGREAIWNWIKHHWPEVKLTRPGDSGPRPRIYRGLKLLNPL